MSPLELHDILLKDKSPHNINQRCASQFKSLPFAVEHQVSSIEYQVSSIKYRVSIILLLTSYFLLLTSSTFAQLYQKEEAVQIMTSSAGKQRGGLYEIIGAFSPTSSLTATGASNAIYPGYIPNLHSRIIVRYDLELQDTDADTDTDKETQVAGVYFPITLTAYDGFGYTARSDSGTKLYLVTNTDKLKLDTDGNSIFDDIYLTLTEGICPSPSGSFKAYSRNADSSLWFKLTDARNLASNISIVTIKPAWISSYSITGTSPQKQGEFWQENISAYDAYGNEVTDVSHLTAHASAVFTLGIPNSYTGRPADDPLKFYLQTTDSGDNPLQLTFSSNNNAIYLKDSQAETIEVDLTGLVHNYTTGDYTGVSTIQKSFRSEPIQILGRGYELKANFNYNHDQDILYVSAWLESEGSIVQPSGSDSGSVTIYDSSGTSLNQLSDDTAEATGIYHFQWSTQLSQTNYLAKVGLNYNNQLYQKDFSFTVEPDITLVERIEQSVKVKLAEDEVIIQSQVPEAGQEVAESVEAIDEDFDRVLVAAEKTIPSHIETVIGQELTPLAKVGIFNTQTYILQGEDLMVNFQTYPSVSPLIDVYGPNGASYISGQAMEALPEEGIYQAKITFSATANRGSYTVVCSESTYGTMDAISVEVGLTSIEKISRDVSSVLGTLGSVQNLKTANIELQTRFENMTRQLEELITHLIFVGVEKLSVTLRSELFNQRQEAMQIVFNGLEEIKEGIEETGLFPQEMVDDVFALHEERALDVSYLQNRMNAAGALLRMLQKAIDNLINAPVQEYWFEFR
jgi:CII-binding regulator of phage lambda lysogenization HflD